MILKIRMNTNPALTVTEMKERKTFLPLKKSYNHDHAMDATLLFIIVTITVASVLDVKIKLKYRIMPERVVSDLYYYC